MTSTERHCLVNGEPTQGEPDEQGNYCGCDACVLAYAERRKRRPDETLTEHKAEAK